MDRTHHWSDSYLRYLRPLLNGVRKQQRLCPDKGIQVGTPVSQLITKIVINRDSFRVGKVSNLLHQLRN